MEIGPVGAIVRQRRRAQVEAGIINKNNAVRMEGLDGGQFAKQRALGKAPRGVLGLAPMGVEPEERGPRGKFLPVAAEKGWGIGEMHFDV